MSEIEAQLGGPQERAPTYWQVLRECPGFRLLFAARSISLAGDWFSMIALIALLREVNGSNAAVLSGLLILKLLPYFLAGPLAGVVADRFSRRAVMLISDVVRAVLVLFLLAAPLTPRPTELVYVVVVLQVAAGAFFEPARSAALPQLVPERYLSAANALGAVMWSVMFTLGSALGGVVTDWLGWRAALLIDSGTYVVSALLVWRIVLPKRKARPRGRADWKTWTGYRDFRDGLAFIWRRRDIASVVFIKMGWGLGGAITLFLTLFGERVYPLNGRPDLGVTLLYVARAVGTGIGPVLARRIVVSETPSAMRRLIAIAFLWPALWYLAFAWVESAGLAALCVVIAHFGGSVLWVYSTVLLQRMTPDEFRGRVMSTDLGLVTLTLSISTGFYGMLAAPSDADLRMLVRVLALSLLVPLAVWLAASRRWLLPRRGAGEDAA